jgi:hypothetical protein
MIVYALEKRYISSKESDVLWCIFSSEENCIKFIKEYGDDEESLLWYWARTTESVDDPDFGGFNTTFYDPVTGDTIEDLYEFILKYPSKNPHNNTVSKYD